MCAGGRIDLVEDEDARLCVELEVVQLRVDGGLLPRPIRIRRVEYVNQEIGLAQFFQRCPKRSDQILRQIGNESNRIDDAHVLAGTQIDAPDRGIEGRKRLIGDEHVTASERIEQRRLTDVGVADERDERLAMRRTPPRSALATDFFELPAQHADAVLNATAIDFELGFTGAARADAAT